MTDKQIEAYVDKITYYLERQAELKNFYTEANIIAFLDSLRDTIKAVYIQGIKAAYIKDNC